jgi:integrase
LGASPCGPEDVQMGGRLTATKAKALTEPGRYGDGGGLWLQVRDAERKSWLFRFTRHGRARAMGLGPMELVSLAEARAAALECRKMLHQGRDPIEAKRAAQAAARADKARLAHTFAEVAEAFIRAHEPSWRSEVHWLQWRQSIANHANPVIGAMPIAAVDMAAVMRVLTPLWTAKPQTASRLRGHLEAIIAHAVVRGLHPGPNPAVWKNHLQRLLPAPGKVARVEHHAALDWREMPRFVRDLRGIHGAAARCLEALVLTACRSAETRLMRWGELDLAAKVWTIPAARMKAGREHRVPLSDAAVHVVEQMRPFRPADDARGDGLVFPSRRAGEPLTNTALLVTLRRMGFGSETTHGMRSAFRDWCAEATNHPREVAEMALAHAVGDATERAYARGDLFQKRRRLMDDWADYCAKAPAEVVALSGRGRRAKDR